MCLVTQLLHVFCFRSKAACTQADFFQPIFYLSISLLLIEKSLINPRDFYFPCGSYTTTNALLLLLLLLIVILINCML